MLLSHSEFLPCEGIGEYRYCWYPSLSMLQELGEGFYLMLARVANRWFELNIQHEITYFYWNFPMESTLMPRNLSFYWR
jgi:hypothetical protein